MMPREIPKGRSEPGFLHAAIAPGIAIALVAAFTAVLDGPVGDRLGERAFNMRFGGTPYVAELTPDGYETLRDLIVARPSIAPQVVESMADGRLDTREMRVFVDQAPFAVTQTTMSLVEARKDVLETAKSHIRV
jgi:hypothetical protein